MKKGLIYFFVMIFIISALPLALSFPKVKNIKPSPPTQVTPPQPQDKPQSSDRDITIKVFMADEKKVVELNLEEYLISVVAGEMPSNFHIEALKAQSVAARSYTINRMNENAENENLYTNHNGDDVCTDYTHCKAYLSVDQMKERFSNNFLPIYSKIKSAVNETDREIAVYENAAICAVFHSTSSGRTENAKDVWGGDVPYLKSVESKGEELSPRYTTEEKVSLADFKMLLTQSDPTIVFNNSPHTYVGEETRGDGGGIITINICGKTFKGSDIRSIFSLRSTNFTIEFGETEAVFHVKGYGHAVGMSQYGANYMANNGSTYDEIIKWYYQGVDIEKIS